MELTPDLPPQYEERMLAAKLDCDRGNGQGDACHAVGEFLSVVKNDHEGARKQFERNCKNGHGASCFALGRLLLGGKGGPTDEKGGERVLKKGCDLQHAPSCHHLGLLAVHELVAARKGLARPREEDLLAHRVAARQRRRRVAAHLHTKQPAARS